MEFYPCPDCSFNHPWRAGERACPNIGLSREDVLRTSDRIAAGKAFHINRGEGRATKVPATKLDATKLKLVDATKLGRPAVGERAMTSTERSRRMRERKDD